MDKFKFFPMKNKLRTCLCCIVLLILFSGCNDEINEVPNGIKISFRTSSFIYSTLYTLHIQEAHLCIAEIDLIDKEENGNSKAEKIVHAGPYNIDLINGSVKPGIRWIFAEPGIYDKIVLTPVDLLPDGNALLIRGLIKRNGHPEPYTFEISSQNSKKITITNNSGIVIQKNENKDLLIEFNFLNFFNEVDLGSIKPGNDGIIRLSDSGNLNTYKLYSDQFELLGSFDLAQNYLSDLNEKIEPDEEFERTVNDDIGKPDDKDPVEVEDPVDDWADDDSDKETENQEFDNEKVDNAGTEVDSDNHEPDNPIDNDTQDVDHQNENDSDVIPPATDIGQFDDDNPIDNENSAHEEPLVNDNNNNNQQEADNKDVDNNTDDDHPDDEDTSIENGNSDENSKSDDEDFSIGKGNSNGNGKSDDEGNSKGKGNSDGKGKSNDKGGKGNSNEKSFSLEAPSIR